MMPVSSLWILAECLFIRHSPGSQEYQAMVAPWAVGATARRKTPKPPPATADEGYWLGCFASNYVCRPCGGLEKPNSSFQLEQPSSHCGSSSFCVRLEERVVAQHRLPRSHCC